MKINGRDAVLLDKEGLLSEIEQTMQLVTTKEITKALVVLNNIKHKLI